MSRKIYVCLGYNGDILNLLPLLYEDHKRGDCNAIMVEKSFAPLLEGVSYVEVLPFDGKVDDIPEAYKQAKALSTDVVCAQVLGPTQDVQRFVYNPAGQQHAVMESFTKEQWKVCGRFEQWSLDLPLIFDRRNKEREEKLLKANPPKARTILVATDGKTSPFPYANLLKALLALKYRKPAWNVVDLDKIRAERLYDIIALMERATVLIANDSAMLHLARAVPLLPVVALANDKPSYWHGSAWRPQHICYVRYGDFASRALEILDAIDKIGPQPVIEGQAIYHAWSGYDLAPENEPLYAKAKATWKVLHDSGPWIDARAELGVFGRDSVTNFGDSRRMPFLKDVVRHAAQRAKPNDIICLTRPDTCLSPDLTELLQKNMPCGYAHRLVTDEEGRKTWFPEVDLFAFTKTWWEENRKDVLDFVMAPDRWWHRSLLEIMRSKGGANLTGAAWRRPSIAKPKPAIAQSRVQYNELLGKDTLKKLGVESFYPPYNRQIAPIALNLRGLFPFGYNPGLIHANNRTLMAYRYHADSSHLTSLALAEIAASGVPTFNKAVAGSGSGLEDPKLFMFDGKLHISFVESTWEVLNFPKSVVRYGKLTDDGGWKITDVVTPAYGRNDGTAMEKNWVFFERSGKLYAIYQSSPKQIVLELDGGKVVAVHESPALRWMWGPTKGGTPPIPYRGALLRFFHSTLDNEPGEWRRRYYVGAMLHNPDPPFKQIRICSEPIVRGSEICGLEEAERRACPHYKANVVFPGGAILTTKGFALAMGVNDSQCAIVSVREEDLKL